MGREPVFAADAPGDLALAAEPVTAAKSRRRQETHQEKRAAMIAAARKVFQRDGYDGASMNDIAAEAAVSKPTLYVYFDSKEKLFDAIIADLCVTVPESAIEPDAADPDVEGQLVRSGTQLMVKIAQPERIEMLRVVAAAAGKFPELGQKFFAAGPGRAINTFRVYLTAVAERGWLKIDDAEIAAFQLLELVQSVHMRRMLFAVAPAPSRAEIEHTVKAGVRVFLAAYRA